MKRRRIIYSSLLIGLLLITIIGLIILIVPTILDKEQAPSPSEAVQDSTPAPSSIPAAAPIVIEPTPEPTPTPKPEPVFAEAVWMAVGDVMMHMPQLPGAYDKQTDRYNFDPFFAEVKPLFEQGDWVIANLEAPIAGKDFGYSGYPLFNAPVEIAEALGNAGFTTITTANNHSLDKGEKGLLRTLDQLKALGFDVTGTAASEEEAEKLLLIEENGIVMGLAAYTYGTNGIPIPSGKPYLVSLIEGERIKKDIARLREAGADFVTISLHFGNEYQTTPSEEQKTLARSLIAAGADIIAGSHPHVVQPYEVIETFDENGRERQGLIIYSMGNFISNQRGDSKDYGVIFKVGIRKNMTEGYVEFTEIEAIPTWVHRYKPDQAYRYRILPIEQTIEAANDPLLTQTEYSALEKNLETLTARLESMK